MEGGFQDSLLGDHVREANGLQYVLKTSQQKVFVKMTVRTRSFSVLSQLCLAAAFSGKNGNVTRGVLVRQMDAYKWSPLASASAYTWREGGRSECSVDK